MLRIRSFVAVPLRVAVAATVALVVLLPAAAAVAEPFRISIP